MPCHIDKYHPLMRSSYNDYCYHYYYYFCSNNNNQILMLDLKIAQPYFIYRICFAIIVHKQSENNGMFSPYFSLCMNMECPQLSIWYHLARFLLPHLLCHFHNLFPLVVSSLPEPFMQLNILPLFSCEWNKVWNSNSGTVQYISNRQTTHHFLSPIASSESAILYIHSPSGTLLFVHYLYMIIARSL